MVNIPLVRAHQCYPFTDFLARAGIPVARLLEQFRVPVEMLESKDLFIDESRMWRLMEYVGRREGLIDLGFQVGEELILEKLGEFGSLLNRQPTLHQAIHTCCEIVSSESVVTLMNMRWRDGYYWLSMHHLPGAPPIHETVELYDLHLMLKIVQSAVGKLWRPPVVELITPALLSEKQRESICDGPIYFRKPAPALAIPLELLSMPMSGFEANAPNASNPQAIPERSSVPTADFATSLRWLIKGYLAECLTVYDYAELLGISERTLQRRLLSAGTSYKKLLDQARFEVARERLAKQNTSVTDLAFDLGYGELGNFTRAFKRWAGVSPRQFRMSQSH